MKTKYSLPFVNEGKEFEISPWSVKKHEHSMARAVEATKDKKDMSANDKENMLKFYVMLEAVQEIDSTVTIEDIVGFFIHPENIVEFFNAVYYEGKRDIYFRKGKKSPSTKKDTSKKN